MRLDKPTSIAASTVHLANDVIVTFGELKVRTEHNKARLNIVQEWMSAMQDDHSKLNTKLDAKRQAAADCVRAMKADFEAQIEEYEAECKVALAMKNMVGTVL